MFVPAFAGHHTLLNGSCLFGSKIEKAWAFQRISFKCKEDVSHQKHNLWNVFELLWQFWVSNYVILNTFFTLVTCWHNTWTQPKQVSETSLAGIFSNLLRLVVDVFQCKLTKDYCRLKKTFQSLFHKWWKNPLLEIMMFISAVILSVLKTRLDMLLTPLVLFLVNLA